MPAITIPIRGIYNTIERPIVQSVLGRMKQLSIITDSIPVVMPNEDGKIKFPNSYDSNAENDLPSLNPGKSFLYVRLENDTNNELLSSTPVRGNHYPPIWKDTIADVYMYPVYTREKYKLNIVYKSYSKEDLQAWYNEIRLRIAQLADMELHTLKYKYLFPMELYKLMKSVYELRKDHIPDINTVIDYAKYGSQGKIVAVGNKQYDARSLAVTEIQSRVVGMFDIDSVLERPEYDEESQRYSVEISYTVEIPVPTSVYVKYPPLICNQLLPEEYVLPVTRAEDNDLDSSYYTDNTMGGLHEFDVTVKEHLSAPYNHIRVPNFDDWVIPTMIDYHAPVLSGLCVIENDNPTQIANLETDLHPFRLSPSILTWLKDGEYKYITKPFKSLFTLTLYNKGRLLDWDYLQIDQNLNITSKAPLKECGLYHIVLWINLDVSSIDDRLLDSIRQYPQVLYTYLAAINRDYANIPAIQNILVKRNVTIEDVSKVFRYYLDNYNKVDMMNIIRGMKTVMFSDVLALSKDEL